MQKKVWSQKLDIIFSKITQLWNSNADFKILNSVLYPLSEAGLWTSKKPVSTANPQPTTLLIHFLLSSFSATLLTPDSLSLTAGLLQQLPKCPWSNPHSTEIILESKVAFSQLFRMNHWFPRLHYEALQVLPLQPHTVCISTILNLLLFHCVSL